MTLFTRTVFLDDMSILSKLDPGTWPERHGHIERRTSNDELLRRPKNFLSSRFDLTILKRNSPNSVIFSWKPSSENSSRSICGLHQRLALFDNKNINCFGWLIPTFCLVHYATDFVIGVADLVGFPIAALILRYDSAFRAPFRTCHRDEYAAQWKHWVGQSTVIMTVSLFLSPVTGALSRGVTLYGAAAAPGHASSPKSWLVQNPMPQRPTLLTPTRGPPPLSVFAVSFSALMCKMSPL